MHPIKFVGCGILALLMCAATATPPPPSLSTPPSAALPAQQTRTDFVFHVYADPIYGDNTEATNRNPTGGTSITAQALFPHNYPTIVGGILQHAPYSFRTITGTNGALAYITAQFMASGSLPWTHLGNGNTMSKIVIHCLPGIYGPGTALDPKSGLNYNGEVFPINLPDAVSIQGTSALDTIFDANGNETTNTGPVFRIVGTGLTGSHAKSFIDSVTIRGATNNGQAAVPVGAGIDIDATFAPVLTFSVSNCFIAENTVGVAIRSIGDEGSLTTPIIVNNTIAWNTIGLWNGSPTSPGSSVGVAQPMILNNIFDSQAPGTAIGAASDFEGVHDYDMQILVAAPSTYRNFNAWNYYTPSPTGWGMANFGTAIAPGWPATTPRTTPVPPTPLVPRVNIQPYTQAGTANARGVLYVNDLFQQALGSDHSHHDFRLAPLAKDLVGNSSIASPLVNRGIALVGPFVFGFTFQSGNGILTPPGLVGPGPQSQGNDTEFAPMNAWDYDCEGFGNPRGTTRAGWAPGFYSNMDIGADEVGRLVMAGFIDRTRIFSGPGAIPNTAITPHHVVYFVNLPGLSAPAYLRPVFNAYVGNSLPAFGGQPAVSNLWWGQARANPNPPASGTNYTDGYAGNAVRWHLARTAPSTYRKGPFMRNLLCDFSPHLLLDIHPFHASAVFLDNTDCYAANPWFTTPAPGFATWAWFDNRYGLWFNPNPTGSQVLAYVAEGTLNPPGTLLNTGAYPQRSWLAGGLGSTYPQWGPWNGGGTPNYSVSTTFGHGDTTGFDQILLSSGEGVRQNCEVRYSTTPGSEDISNLQTFLSISDYSPLGGKGGSGNRTLDPRIPSRFTTARVRKWVVNHGKTR